MTGSIVLAGDSLDLHLVVVAAELRRRGREPVVLYGGDVREGATGAVRLDGASQRAGARSAQTPAALRDVGAVYGRAVHPRAFDGLDSRPNCVWMNHRAGATVASIKLIQLRHAARVGLRVPRMRVTSDPETAWDFRAECGGRIVARLLSDPMIGGGGYVEDRAASRLVLLTMERTHVPVLLQEHLASTGTVRVIVVEQRTFARPVLGGQLAPGGGELPAQIARRCVELVRSFGLRYAAIELAVTPDDHCVFLELDPDGAFLDTDAALPENDIVRAIADTLTRTAAAPAGAAAATAHELASLVSSPSAPAPG